MKTVSLLHLCFLLLLCSDDDVCVYVCFPRYRHLSNASISSSGDRLHRSGSRDVGNPDGGDGVCGVDVLTFRAPVLCVSPVVYLPLSVPQVPFQNLPESFW